MALDNIPVTYEEKRKRLVFRSPFWAVDVMRSFPSRRFEPKSKAWHVPLTRANIAHFAESRNKYDFEIDAVARAAIENFEFLTSGPRYVPFPTEKWYPGKKWQPLEHQFPMLDYGWGLEAFALIAAMGTGKTFVTISVAMARHKFENLGVLVIISPETLHNTWKKELFKYTGMEKITVRAIKTGDRGFADWLKNDPELLHIVLVSVEGMGVSEKMFDAACAAFIRPNGKKVMAVVDESSRIKNPKALRTKRTIQFGPMADWRMILNGTPIAKGIQDLWTQYEFLDPNIIGTGDYWAFKARYLIYGGFENKKLVGYTNTEELMALIRPYTLEVPKSVLNLIPKLYKPYYLSPSNEQMRLLKKIKSGDIDDGHWIKTENVLERMLRSQQVVGGFMPSTDMDTEITTSTPLDANPKFDLMMDIIEGVEQDSKFIIWARYIPEIELITSKLRLRYGTSSVVDYYGATSKENRAIAEEAYCSDPNVRFFVGNPAAAGLGLTLISPGDDILLYYSGTFGFIDRTQSEDRAHRIGQTRTVTVIDLIMEGTIDETIVAAHALKMDVDAYVKHQINIGKDQIIF